MNMSIVAYLVYLLIFNKDTIKDTLLVPTLIIWVREEIIYSALEEISH